MFNSTLLAEILKNPGLTEFEKYSHISEVTAPIVWGFLAIMVISFLLFGLLSIDIRGKRKLLITQGPFLGLGVFLITLTSLLALSFQFFPAVGWWIIEIIEKFNNIINR